MNRSITAQDGDNTAITYQAQRPQSVIQRLKTHANNLANCCVKWKIAINDEKSEALLIKCNRRYYSWKRIAKYLEEIIDDKLLFNKHCQEIRRETIVVRTKVCPVIGIIANRNYDTRLRSAKQ